MEALAESRSSGKGRNACVCVCMCQDPHHPCFPETNTHLFFLTLSKHDGRAAAPKSICI